jgi:hypothetical protein
VECKNKNDTYNNRGKWNHLKIINKIPGKQEIKEVKKTVKLGTAHILRKGIM